MKNLFQLLILLLVTVASFGQYNPSLHTVSNTAFAMAQSGPADARSYFYDATVFKYRPYVSLTEVRNYLNLAKYRAGQFDIVVNTGGTLSNGVITGGTNAVWYFKDGTADGDLVLKGAVSSVNGQAGAVITKNADSLKNLPIDTSARRDGWVLAFDSTAHKWYLVAQAQAATLVPSTGITILDNVISATNTVSIWDANKIRGRSISAAAPPLSYVLKYNGTEWAPDVDDVSLDTAFFSNDTLYLVGNGDTSKVLLSLTPVGDNWGTQTINSRLPLSGGGTPDDLLKMDTSTAAGVATKHDRDSILALIAALPGGGPWKNVKNATATGDTLSFILGDTAFVKRLEAGANISLTPSANKIIINGTGGTAEINTLPYSFTLGVDSSATIPAGTMVDEILVKPTANLTVFKVGSQSDDDAYITSSPVQADTDWQILISPIHFASSGKLYFSGMSSATQIKIIIKPLHE